MVILLAFLLLLFYGAGNINCSTVNHKNMTDMLSLLDFKAATNDPTGALRSWDRSVHYYNSTGVRCSQGNPGRVAALQLPGFVVSHFIGVTVVRRVGPPEHPSALRLLPLQPRKFYRVLPEHRARADQIVLRQCKKKARQMQYEVRYVAISTYYHDYLGVKMTKEEARRMGITLERDEFLAVCPNWCYGKDESWAALVDLWCDEAGAWAAMRVKNKANRGKEGVHAQGNRNHYLHKAVNAWEIAHTRKDPKPGEPKYYGKKTAHRKKAYSDGYLALHPDTPDAIAADLDERVVVGMGPKEHGREAFLDAVITPTISYT
ncbi:uncharacterized protein [Aegilops tauschii subsp. strangulata]